MNSQVLSVFGDFVNGIGNIFSGVANWFSDRIGQYIDYFLSLIYKLVYEILKVFFIIIDFVQLLFRKIAGLDTVSYSGNAISGDIAWWLFQQKAVTDVLISLTVVAVVMVFMATFIAIVRNHYKAKDSKETAVGPVIGQAFKALISFAFVPVVCYFGVFVSNGLLRTIDQATRISDSLTISGELFSASAMNSNRARLNSDFAATLASTEGLNFGIFIDDNTGSLTAETAADKIDKAFASKLDIDDQELTINDSMAGCGFMFHQNSIGTVTQFDYMNTDLVYVYYDLSKFNWLFAFVSCFFITTTLLVAAMGVVQRLFEITILFAISPPFIALMPLDGGKAFGNWAKKFIQSTICMYGTVVALNFFFIVAPLLQNIDLFYTAEEIKAYGKLTCDLFNSFAHILFIMCGSLIIKDYSKLLDELVTGSDKGGLQGRGENVRDEAKKEIANVAEKANTVHKAGQTAKNQIKTGMANHKQNKQTRQEAKDKKSAYKAAAKGLRDAGEVGYLGSRRAVAEQMAADKGKATLRSRVMGKSDKLSTAQSHIAAGANEALKKGGVYDVNKNNASKQGVLKRAKNKATLKSPRRLSANAVKSEVGNKYETQEMKKYKAARKDYANEDLRKNMKEGYMLLGQSEHEAETSTNKKLKGNLKTTEKDLKASRKLKEPKKESKKESKKGFKKDTKKDTDDKGTK